MEYTTIKVEPIAMTQKELQTTLKKPTNVEEESPRAHRPLATTERVEHDQLAFNTSDRFIAKPYEPTAPREVELQRAPRELSSSRETERLREIERAREINDYYYMTRAPPPVPPQLPPKDSFDLFFESVSATVKALPPKLGAEVKSQVSQLIANFELRAICEKEAQDKAAAESAALTAPVANLVGVNRTINTIPSGTEMSSSVAHPQQAEGQAIAHYVYSYQPK